MTAPVLRYAPLYLAVILVAGAAGVLLAWWLRRHTTVSIRNLYLAAVAAAGLDAWALHAHATNVLIVMAPITSFVLAASAVGRRWRLSDLGAGEELRAHERARRWLWQPRPERTAGERVHIATQGQIVRERPWPASEPYVPMTADETGPARAATLRPPHLLRRRDRHRARRRRRCARQPAASLKDHAALFFVDQKGDPDAEAFLRDLAAAIGVPFILFDPRADDSDHWQPLWGERPAEVVARVLAGIQTSEPYYADVLRLHVGIVASVLHAAGYWPPSFPLLVEASQLARFDRVVALAREHQARPAGTLAARREPSPVRGKPGGRESAQRRPRPPQPRHRRSLAQRPDPTHRRHRQPRRREPRQRDPSSARSSCGAPTSTSCPTKHRPSPRPSSTTSTQAPSKPKPTARRRGRACSTSSAPSSRPPQTRRSRCCSAAAPTKARCSSSRSRSPTSRR